MKSLAILSHGSPSVRLGSGFTGTGYGYPVMIMMKLKPVLLSPTGPPSSSPGRAEPTVIEVAATITGRLLR